MKKINKRIESVDSQKLTFNCKHCERTFDSIPTRFEDEPERSHPFRYYAHCDCCSAECEQIAWQVGILCANANATGPKTEAGKAKSAANLDGHPTPQETAITRLNALKHGANAKVTMLFPARPGKYSHCKSCDIAHDYCAKQPACLKRTELFMKHFIAMDTSDPTLLKDIHSANQASLSALFESMLIEIFSDGVTLRNPAFGFSKDGDCNIAQYIDKATGQRVTIEEVKAHPLLKPLFELLSRNNLSLADLNMTPKIAMEQGISAGQISEENQSKEQLTEYQNKTSEALKKMSVLIERSRQSIKDDPVLKEYETDDNEE